MSSDFDLKPPSPNSSGEMATEHSAGASPEMLGPYRIKRMLGRGGMGCVYLATDEQLNRTVALKTLNQNFAEDDEARVRFFREARAAAALKHENIVTIYQVGEDQGTPFLAMEHLEGKSLEEWLRPDRRANVAQTFSIGKQIARGLAAAHAAGVIHRDIKPANIWIGSNGRIKILDFGLAYHAAGNLTKLTQDGALLGTPAYMSPEQARGEPVDERSDLFSFGCVLYRMVTGRLPFQAEGIFGVIAAITSEQQLSPRVVNPAVPESLSSFIDKLLKKSREDRPVSADAVVTSLRKLETDWRENSQSDSAAFAETIPYSPDEETTPSPSLRLGKPLWMGLAVLLVVGGLGLWFAINHFPQDSGTGGSQDAKVSKTADPSGLEKAGKPDAKPHRIDLMANLNASQSEYGNWRRVGDAIIGLQPQKDARSFGMPIPLSSPLPESYCLRMRVERFVRQPGALLVGLASGSSRFNFFIDATLPKYEGMFAGINPDLPKRFGGVLTPQLAVDLAFWVRKDRLRVTANDQEIYSWSGDFSKLHRMPSQSLDPLKIGGQHPAVFQFTEITLEPLETGENKPSDSK